MGSMTHVMRMGVLSAGVVLTLGVVAAPVMAQPQRSFLAAQTQDAAAPAPTGLAYTYDIASQTVTVTWDPKDPADTITRNYRPGSCGPTPQYPCFIAPQVILGNSFSFKKAPNTAPAYVKIYAENAIHQYTGSQILTVTVD
ncbi:hypothetical protein ABZ478_22625 [Streptomyces sp. NPDC005706]|uniref:hypothetical protein n=1 Tax=Streptomyces sp. NPDC005706 TaxID=3157169 RepID=UPI0033C0D4F0